MSEADVVGIDYAVFSALITTGTVLAAEPSRGAAFRSFELARAAGLPLIFDVDYRPYSWPSPQVAAQTYSRAAAQCDVIVGNDVEFGFMAGDYSKGLDKARRLARDGAGIVIYKMGEGGAITITPMEEIRSKATPSAPAPWSILDKARRLARDGAGIVIYKMGEGGAITITPMEEIRSGVFPVRAIKPTGAGDSFLGGLVAALAAGFSLRDAVLRGSACAAIVVSRVGCAPAMPTTAELEQFLATHPSLSEA
ncbi:PfkB family carbohydrate kinase [Rhizobium sp. Root274]